MRGHFQLIIITNVLILTDPTYFVPPSCHCGILALRSRDFWEITLREKHVFSLFTFYRTFCTILTDPAYFVPPSCHCGILALRSRDFWEITLTAKHVFGLFTWKTWKCWMRVHLRDHSKRKTRVQFVYVLPDVLHGDFFIWNKIFSQSRVKYFTNINQKCYSTMTRWRNEVGGIS
jgi:hypothetical protein